MPIWIRLAGAAVLLGVATANAQQRPFDPLPYNYLYAGYALTELDAGGIEIGGSIEVANRIQVFGGYYDWELGNGFDRSGYRIGGGYRWTVSSNMHFVAKLAFADTELDRSGAAPDIDEEGLVLSGEIRGWASERIELSGELFLDDSLGSDLETVLEFGGQYHLNRNLSAGGRLRVDDDDTTLLLGVRFNFGRSTR